MKTNIGGIEVDTVFGNNSWETIKRVADYVRENDLDMAKVCELIGWHDNDKKELKTKDGKRYGVFLGIGKEKG